MIIGALLIAGAIPLFFLYLIYALDFYNTGSFRAVALCFLWGGVAVALATITHSLLVRNLAWLTGERMALFVAPPVEEILKAAILLYLIRRANFTYFVDGAIYGFAVGIGFAVFENYLYITQSLDAGLGTAAGRVLSTNLMHASASAMVGIALGLSRFRRFSGRALALLVGLALAILFHAAFNSLVTRTQDNLLLLYAIGVGLAGAAFVVLMVRRGLAEEKRWIAEKLGAPDRVTAAEVAAVHRLEHIDALLEPMVHIFGRKKTNQIEDFLLLQAQLGILRKAREKLGPTDKRRPALEKQLEAVRLEMDQARRSVGAYTMIALRTLFPPGARTLWSQLEMVLRERATTRQSNVRADLFALADRRMREKEIKSAPEE